MIIDWSKPVRTELGHRVDIISTRVRAPGVSAIGYIGGSAKLFYWDQEGNPRPRTSRRAAEHAYFQGGTE